VSYLFKVAVLSLIFSSSQSFAAPASLGQVERFYINQSGLVLFRLGASANLPTECSNVNWPYMFNTDDKVGKEWVSMLLAARATKEIVKIGYGPIEDSDQCSVIYLYD
jgi:hypothetical protein